MYNSFVWLVVFVVVNFCAASFTCRFALSLAVTVVIVVIVVVVDLAFITAFADVQMYILMQDAPLIVHGFFFGECCCSFRKEQVFRLGTIKFVDYPNGLMIYK